MKKISQGSTDHNIIILVIFSRRNIETWKVSQTFFKFQSMSILAMRSYADNEKQFQWLNIDWEIVFLM